MSSNTASKSYRVIVEDMDGLKDGEVRIAPHIRVVDARAAAWSWLVDLVAAAEVAGSLSLALRKENWLISTASDWMQSLHAVGVKVHIEAVPNE